MNLTSGISKRFKQSFVLDEDTLRRLHGLMEKAAKDLSFPTSVVFHVEREDNRYYETANIDEVLSDPNIPGKRISTLGVELRPETKPAESSDLHSKDWNVVIAFRLREKEEPFPDPDRAYLKIATHDKNWALLLADELEPHIQRTLKTRQTPRWLLILSLIPLIFLVIKLSRDLFKIPEAFRSSGSIALTASILALIITTRLWDKPCWFYRLFGPEAVFLWGEEAISYAEREQTRRNIQWAVIVAFLVSVTSSIVVQFLPIATK